MGAGAGASRISGTDLHAWVVAKWGRSYEVRLHKRGPRMYLQVMWKFAEQASFHLTREEYDAQLDAVADYLNGWGVADVVRAGIQVRRRGRALRSRARSRARAHARPLWLQQSAYAATPHAAQMQDAGTPPPANALRRRAATVRRRRRRRRAPARAGRATTTAAAPSASPFLWTSTSRAAAAPSSTGSATTATGLPEAAQRIDALMALAGERETCK